MMKKIPSSGSPSSPIWLVGEAPGANEELEGRPFIGPAGMELNYVLKSAGISRDACFVTNVCPYRPPGNDIGAWMSKKHFPESHHIGQWYVNAFIWEGIQELEALLKSYRPHVVVALGNVALLALTGKWGIDTWRGSVLDSTFGPKVVPTYHPSYLLRLREARVEAIADLTRARRESAFPEHRVPEWRFHIRPATDDVLKFLENLGPRAVVDIETTRRQISCMGIASGPYEAMCIPFYGVDRTLEEELEIILAIKRAFATREVVGQNFLYDSFYLSSLWGFRPKVAFDTMIAQGVLFPGFPKRLDYLASLYCPYYSYWKRDGKEWGKVPNYNDLWVYNCLDCVYTWQVWRELEGLIKTHGQEEQFAFLMALCGPVHEIMLKGLRVDATALKPLAKSVADLMEKQLAYLTTVFGHEVAPHNTHQLKRLFYTDFGIPEIKSRKTGNTTVDREAMERIKCKEPLLSPAIDAIQNYRTLNILRSQLVDAVAEDNRLYTSLNPVGTITFRFSSTENPFHQGTNLQNIAKNDDDNLPDIRRAIVPDEGHVLMEYDLSKADLHVVVWESEENELKAALRAGINIYRDIAADVVKMPYSLAKRFVHGTNYGGRPRTMAINCGITIHEAEVAQARWFGQFKGIREWHRRVEDELNRTRTVKNKFGFRYIFFGRTDLPQALAWCPQSTVAIVINKGLLALRNLGVDVLMQIHDSVLFQTPRDAVKQTDELVKRVFSQIIVPYADPLVIPIDGKVGECWGKMEAL